MSYNRRTPSCRFCRNNQEEVYDHVFKDSDGRVVCPVLSSHVCDLCGATGPVAHTRKYCPRNPITRGDPQAAGLPRGMPYYEYVKVTLECLEKATSSQGGGVGGCSG